MSMIGLLIDYDFRRLLSINIDYQSLDLLLLIYYNHKTKRRKIQSNASNALLAMFTKQYRLHYSTYANTLTIIFTT